MQVDGEVLASKITNEVKRKVSSLSYKPGLAVVIVGDDPASKIYVSKKVKKCRELGMHSELIEFPKDVSERELLDKIQELNDEKAIHGILVQMPLPSHISSDKIISSVLPSKDVDGFHPCNLGKLFCGEELIVPCTPKGIIKVLEAHDVKISGKHAVIIGRSVIVGKPVAALLLNRDATVTVCHSKTENLSDITKKADILIAAVGKPRFITAEMIKDGAVVIDVGINRTSEGVVGDVDFESVKSKASLITPVPGGVGPMTIAMLMENVLELAERGRKCGIIGGDLNEHNLC